MDYFAHARSTIKYRSVSNLSSAAGCRRSRLKRGSQKKRDFSSKMALNIKKVLISDEIDEKCVKILRDNSIEAVKNTKLSKEELLVEIPVSIL